MLKSIPIAILLLTAAVAQVNIYVDSSCHGPNSTHFFSIVQSTIETHSKFKNKKYKFVYDSAMWCKYEIKFVAVDEGCAVSDVTYYLSFIRPGRDYIHNIKYDERPYLCSQKNSGIEALKVAMKIDKFIVVTDSIQSKVTNQIDSALLKAVPHSQGDI